MDTDDLEPPRPMLEPKDFEVMSIEALGEYIADLEAEIKRARLAIKVKEQAQRGAEDYFKK
ncbi:MAG: DUF1192 domain-containing protein [Alphaproteobacteria bacterium]